MPTIIIGGSPIDFPDSGASPDWSSAIIQFAVAVQNALDIAVGPFDVQPQSFDISSYNGATNIAIPSLSFPIGEVRAAFINYAIFRTTSLVTAYEAGNMVVVYNPNNSVNLKWTLSQGDITGNGGQTTFSITDAGQIQFTTATLSGINHTGQITFSARSLLQS